MEIEAKLDEDFLFYLNFTNTFLRRITDRETLIRAKLWLYKLIGEPCEGIQRKRCRNIYFSHLLVNIQNSKLEGPFQQNPFDVDVANATEVFGPIPETIEPPSWLNDTEFRLSDEPREKKQGRTYVATRTLPNGQGAFAYIGVSLTDKEPMWIGAGEGSLDERLKVKFAEMVPPQYEMEKILARRKDPKEREKVLNFYDVLLRSIADELDGKLTDENETVEGLLVQLIHDLNNKGQYEQYEGLEETERRIELLMLLFQRVKARRDRVAQREEVLDELEQKVMPQSFFEASELLPEDKYKFPAVMWEQAIDKLPTKEQMERLQAAYPLSVIKKFLECLSAYKEKIAMRMQRRHENIVSQMKKEMRKEGEKKRKIAEDSQRACESAMAVLEAVRAQYKKKMDMERRNKEKETVELSEHSKMYENMKAAVFDTQRMVEEEALRGKFLANQINAVSEQSEQFNLVNDDIIKKTEEANMKFLKNIRNLGVAIKRYENMIADMRSGIEGQKKATQLFFF